LSRRAPGFKSAKPACGVGSLGPSDQWPTRPLNPPLQTRNHRNALHYLKHPFAFDEVDDLLYTGTVLEVGHHVRALTAHTLGIGLHDLQ